MEQNTNTDIFNKICDVVTDQEFNEVQMNFFQNNCQEFDEEDENKLIYQTIHQEYVHILENSIEVNLLEQFTKQQIDQFYDHMKKNINEY